VKIFDDTQRLIPAELVDERYRELSELVRKRHECEVNKDYMSAAKLGVEIIKLRKQLEGEKKNDMR
jgi:hypothetical protein